LSADTTILIVARNAEATIERCIRSAIDQKSCELLLVDDFSSDATVELARGVAAGRLRVVRPAEHTKLGAARQFGLENIETKFAAILDADDALLPGRVARLVDLLERDEADLAFDELALYDGDSGEWIRDLKIPSFLKSGSDLCRLFERNYLPGIGQPVFRTSCFQRIGYDPDLHGPEDSDIVLRSLLAGAKAVLCREIGYRMYH